MAFDFTGTVKHVDGACCFLGGVELRRVRSGIGSAPTVLEATKKVEPEGPPGVVAGISPFYEPGSLAKGVQVPDFLPQEGSPGIVVLKECTGPQVYMVHGLPGVDVTQTLIAQELEACHVCSLIYDTDAWKCNSITKLAQLFCERLVREAWKGAVESDDGALLPPLAIAGCSFGCIIAHEMALQLEEAGITAKLILFALDACWPPSVSWPVGVPSPTTDVPEQPKDCGWLGGEVESALLTARASGAVEWAEREVMRKGSADKVDAEDVMMRAYWEHARHFGMSFERFGDFVCKVGSCSERLHVLTGVHKPTRTFSGHVEFVMSRAAWADVPSLFSSD